MKVRSLFAKEGYNDSCVIIEDICLYLIESLPKTHVDQQHFSKLEYIISNPNTIMDLSRVEMKFLHMMYLVEVDWLELVLENINDFLLKETCKVEDDVHNFWGNLNSNIIFFCQFSLWNSHKSNSYYNNSSYSGHQFLYH